MQNRLAAGIFTAFMAISTGLAQSACATAGQTGSSPQKATLLDRAFQDAYACRPDKAMRDLTPLLVHAARHGIKDKASAAQIARYMALIAKVMRFDDNDETGVRAFEIAHMLNPDDIEVTAQLAMVLNRVGREQEAEKLIKDIVAPNAGRSFACAWCYMGELFIVDNHAAAKEVILNALKTVPSSSKNFKMHLLCARAYSVLGLIKPAQRELELAIKYAPNEYYKSLDKCFLEIWKENQTSAIDSLRVAARCAPDDSAWKGILAQELSGRGEQGREEATKLFREALQSKRFASRIIYMYVGFLNGRDQSQVQLRTLDNAQKMMPHNPEMHWQKGLVYQSIKDYERAEQELKKARELQPNNGRYINSLASLYVEQKHNDDAEKLLSESVARMPWMSQSWSKLGSIYLKAGKWPQAQQAYEKAVEFGIQPSPDVHEAILNEVANAHAAVGICFYKQGQLPGALEEAQKYNRFKFEPKLPDYLKIIKVRPGKIDLSKLEPAEKQCMQHVLLGDMLLQMHQLDDATNELKAALAVNPSSIDLHSYLLNVYSESGNWVGSAQEDWEISRNLVGKVPGEIGKAINQPQKKNNAKSSAGERNVPPAEEKHSDDKDVNLP